MPIIREIETKQTVIENKSLSELFRELADWVDANQGSYIWEIFVETERDDDENGDGTFFAKITQPK